MTKSSTPTKAELHEMLAEPVRDAQPAPKRNTQPAPKRAAKIKKSSRLRLPYTAN